MALKLPVSRATGIDAELADAAGWVLDVAARPACLAIEPVQADPFADWNPGEVSHVRE